MNELQVLQAQPGKSACYGMLSALGTMVTVYQSMESCTSRMESIGGGTMLVEFGALMKYGERLMELLNQWKEKGIRLLYTGMEENLSWDEDGLDPVVLSGGRNEFIRRCVGAWKNRVEAGREPKREPKRETKAATVSVAETFGELDAFAGISEVRNRLLRQVSRYVPYNVPILLTGEAGVGKTFLAKLISEAYSLQQKISAFRSGAPEPECPFISCPVINYASATMESTLFGHVKGAFTGAVSDHDGKLAIADGGILFFDEVAEIPLEVQAKLLEFLQQHTYSPMGSNSVLHSDARIISATNRDVLMELAAGRMRRDFYERIAGKIIHVPSLNERLEDIPVLAALFLHRVNEKYGLQKELSEGAVSRLLEEDWTDRNIRGLEFMIKRMAIEAETDILSPDLVDSCR